MPSRRRTALAAALVLAPVLAACGSSTGSVVPATTGTATGGIDISASPTSPSTGGAAGGIPSTFAPGPGPTPTAGAAWAVTDCAKTDPPVGQDAALGGTTIAGVTVAGDKVDQAPQIAVALTAQPAADLVAVDLIPGTGEVVAPGATVKAQYCGVGLASRALFDASWARGGEPATFPLDRVIPGWTNGLPGMKVGGRRLLIIPGAQAYGATPPSPQILPDETLIFVVDMVAAQNPGAAPNPSAT